MASTYLDEFVLNFDLNHLAAEENVQSSNHKYEKLRKSVSWLKSRIISTDFAIQKFQAKKEDLEQSVKAHSVTREELKQVCISYKDASEKCVILENDNKTLLGNQEALKKNVIDLENKYDALISHTNQLQMLVKQLENEKDALTVEKELNKCNNKDGNQVTELQQEKDSMLKDFIALKDVIIGKKKTSKRHVNIIKKYVKDVKYKATKILCTSEESDDDVENYCDISTNARNKLHKVHNDTDKGIMLSVEQNFIDNCSDGQISVDTGRGSSRANSHDKYLSSPDYVVNLETLLKHKDVIKQVDVANSPITVNPLRSIATSPIIFDDPGPLFEDHYDNYTDCIDDAEYIIDDVPICDEIDNLVEQEKLADCASPMPDIDTDTSPMNNYKYIIIKESSLRPLNKSLFDPIDPDEVVDFHQDTIIDKEIPGCMCNKTDTLVINDNKKFNDACTSPLPTSNLRKFVDIGVGTAEHHESIKCLKSTVSVGINTINEMEREKQTLTNCEQNSTNNITLTKKIFVDASTSTNFILFDNCEEVDKEISDPSKNQNKISTKSLHVERDEYPTTDKKISRSLDNKRCSRFSDNRKNPAEEKRTQEKVCLESNSSKKLHFESTNDVEVQDILNVMKLHHDLISPISKSPSDSEYLKLIPEMNYTLTKIWATIQNIYKMPNPLRNSDTNLQNSIEHNYLEEETEMDNSTTEGNFAQQQTEIFRTEKHIVEEDITCAETPNIFADNICSERLFSGTKNSNLIEPNVNKSDLFDNTFLPQNKSCKTILSSEENKRNCSDKISEGHVINTKKTDHINLTSEDNNKQIELQVPNYSEVNEYSDGTTNITTYINNNESNISETRTSHTIIINGIKTKKKSKLDKLRNKLLPTCKIKKITSPVIKRAPKTYIKPKNTAASLSLNQKLAYENAVKVMAELRSNQELKDKKKEKKSATNEINMENKSSNIETPSDTVELNVLSTRSRTRSLSKKEDTTTVTANPEQNIRDIEKSPLNRKLRKRPADTEVDTLRSNSKRILRSSSVTQVTTKKVLSDVRNDNVAVNIENNNECGETVMTGIYLDNSFSKSKSKNCEGNVENKHDCSKNELTADVECDSIFGSSIRRTKPVIDLSKCLADNANAVSIIPGNVGYLDINKNNKLIKESVESNSHMLDNHKPQNLEMRDSVVDNNLLNSPNTDHCIQKHNEVTHTSRDNASEGLIETKDTDSTTVNECANNVQEVNRSETSSPRSNEQSLCVQDNDVTNIKHNTSLEDKLREEANIEKNPVVQLIPLKNIVNYGDLDLYTEDSTTKDKVPNTPPKDNQRRNENILCSALDRYGVISVKYAAKKVPDTITIKICQKIEESITKIIASSKAEQKRKMDDLVNSIQNFKTKYILAGLMKYLKDPTRKHELFNKIVNGPAPPMTKSEVILLYVVECLNGSLPAGFINRLWNNMEHALFQLNRAPEFDIIESISHFYAVLCRYFRNKSRLRCFMLDAMYCLQFKAIPLIRQCLDVCPGVLPNAHERMAKTSLVTCLVYLLHFYKCQDKFNRAQDIRTILNRKYHYRFSEWNETMILEIFRKAIMDFRGTYNDKKMLRVALIILCKRHGAKWCQMNIIQNILLPIIEKKEVPERIKQFCVLMLGPLLKPFPTDRKAQCEIVINQLLQMLKQNASQEMKEAIYSSLIFMNKHDQEQVVHALLSWNPEKVSPEFEEILNDYVMEKPLAVWKKLVTRKLSPCT